MANMFNEDGTYNKTNWKAGDKITAGKLNKIEESLEAINNNDISRHVEADTRLDALEEQAAGQNEVTNERIEELIDLVLVNKDELDLEIYDINSRMTFLEEELNEGIEEVNNVASTVDGKIATAQANMATQVNQGKADMEAMVAEVEAEMDNLNDTTDRIVNKEIISIMDCGAVGDKVNDDTLAIQQALKLGRYVTAKGEKHYIITDMIVIPKYTTLDFNNAFVTFMGQDACFQLKGYSALKNVRIVIPEDLILSKSVIYIDGNDCFNVGQPHTPNIENITIDQHISSEEGAPYRENTGIWFEANQQTANTSCCITGILVEKVKAKLLKRLIYLSAKDQQDNISKVYITSNTFRDILAYNCLYFIKDEVLEDSSDEVSIEGNVYDNLHFQPADDKETYFLDICSNGNSITNALFWDNGRPSNNTGQIIIRGNYNSISGSRIPPFDTQYVDIQGNYNFYQGFTYGIPTQYFGGKYVSDRGYQKRWHNKLIRTEHIYETSIESIDSGVITDYQDVETMMLPLTYGDLGTGYTRIHFKSIGTCDSSSQVRRFWAGLHDLDFRCGGSLPEAYGEQYDCDTVFIIRKYKDYSKVCIHIKVIINESLVLNKVYHETIYNITADTVINPRLRLGSTNAGGTTQIYREIGILFYE